MFVTVKDILSIDNCSSFDLITGEGGLSRKVSAVGILEDEAIQSMCDIFHPGDFVLTTLYTYKDMPNLLIEVVNAFIKIGVSGLVIKEKYYNELPNEVIKLAKNHDFPLFFMASDINTEDVIYDIINLLKIEEDNTYLESKIYGILSGNMSGKLVKKVALEINTYFEEWVMVSYIRGDVNFSEVVRMANANPYKLDQNSILVYDGGILIIESYKGDQKESSVINQMHFKTVSYAVGESRKNHSLEKLDKAIVEAVQSAKVADLINSTKVAYDHIGVYKLLLPLIEEESLLEYYSGILNPIFEYDQKYNANFFKTLDVFVANFGDYTKTAQTLFQHKNTIRYRIGKIKDLIDVNEATGSFLEQSSLAIRIYHMIQ